jgi:hypothetical protein
MNIKVNVNDIFDYVVGNSNYDAIEKIIDPARYEIFDCGIYDNKTKKMIEQCEQYSIYCSAVSNLRKNASEMSPWEINKLCLEILEISPKSINLE